MDDRRNIKNKWTYLCKTWKSSNTKVATINSSGVATAKAAGTTTITVTTADGGKTATCKLTVVAVPNTELGEVIFDDYTAFSIYQFDVDDGTLRIDWSCENADYYDVRAITTDTKPVQGESQTAISTIVDKTGYTKEYYTIDADDLDDGDYLKFAVHAYDADDNPSDYWYWIAFKIIRSGDGIITATLGSTDIELTLGETYQLTGTITATNTTITRVSLTVDGFSGSDGNRYATKTFSTSKVTLGSHTDFKIDTSKAPFNKAGTYFAYLWAADTDGVGTNLGCIRIIIRSEIDLSAKFTKIKKLFPHLNYWCHTVGSSWDEYTVRTTECSCKYKHGASRLGSGNHPTIDGSCGCNEYFGIQCYGYANVVAYELFGSAAVDAYGNVRSGWSKYTGASYVDSLQPGDVIRIEPGHSAVVTAVSDTKITVTDCNWEVNCQIYWGRTYTKTNLYDGGKYELLWFVRHNTME